VRATKYASSSCRVNEPVLVGIQKSLYIQPRLGQWVSPTRRFCTHSVASTSPTTTWPPCWDSSARVSEMTKIASTTRSRRT